MFRSERRSFGFPCRTLHEKFHWKSWVRCFQSSWWGPCELPLMMRVLGLSLKIVHKNFAFSDDSKTIHSCYSEFQPLEIMLLKCFQELVSLQLIGTFPCFCSQNSYYSFIVISQRNLASDHCNFKLNQKAFIKDETFQFTAIQLNWERIQVVGIKNLCLECLRVLLWDINIKVLTLLSYPLSVQVNWSNQLSQLQAFKSLSQEPMCQQLD